MPAEFISSPTLLAAQFFCDVSGRREKGTQRPLSSHPDFAALMSLIDLFSP